MDEVRKELADFFCEDRDTFKLEECFKLFHGFCQRFKTGVMENEHRRQHEAAAEMRRRQREEQLALKRRQSGKGRSPSFSSLSLFSRFVSNHLWYLSSTDNSFTSTLSNFSHILGGHQGSTGGNDSDNVMDSLLLDIRNGFPMRDKVILFWNLP